MIEKKVEEFGGELLQQYQNGPSKITNPISIKTMKDFIESTEKIANVQDKEEYEVECS